MLESHGGYLCRLESLDPALLVKLARRALPLDGIEDVSEASLLVSAIPRRKIVRLAFDAVFTYGRRGARWYETHHALASLASRELGTVVHAYVFDVDEMEQAISYGNGTRVGGEQLFVEDFEPPDDEELDDDHAFEKLKDRWPLGHLAHVYGVSRDELIRMPRQAQGALLDLRNPNPEDLARLEQLLPVQRHASGM
jgi:hypothetical protein